ncbi:hypothetical protein WSS15_09590 [Acetobacter pasteurianus]|uniref:Uncharacterized protein n=4 Tax=Acetobacter pasteurianus TaxID=438 RepID=A0A401WQH7_ACEPA|nr:hypothetical protein [Acetobacter pasteurianus]BAU37401.1 hypothetical protein APT_00319 [Acetobacter pasteurianus NBRC 101655]ASC05254.1 hypothetical protein S101468_00987 [Acetobacter pasteurianus subsp. pasteurianus]QHM91194.1 hypothetical protein FCN51_06270 [Acetobacter pasteurianus]CCT59904.1 hypothetical protein APA386B_1834 [Acetobacter pasteurianus 386B]BAH98504.1 hypothetical protein APA01_03530 [Acetobacter pasteurianus IFO 3283-01]
MEQPSPSSTNTPEALRERRTQMITAKLPTKMRRGIQWLRKPEQKWVRLPSGLLLILGGLLSFLPVLGVWMLPLGILLLAEDIPLFQSLSGKMLGWIARRKPSWLGIAENETEEEAFLRVQTFLEQDLYHP